MIKLRHLTEDDLEKVMRWRTSEHVTKYMFTDINYDLTQQEKWFNLISSDPTKQTWIIEYANNEVGVAYLTGMDFLNKRCFKGYYIAEFFALGIGLTKVLECNIYDYVFHIIKFNKVYSDVLAFNERAIHVYKKYGSEIEGRFKQHVFKKGKFHDVIRMAILKDKWINIRDNYDYDAIEIEPYE